MKFEHVTPPEVNYFPMYSIEYRPKHNPCPAFPVAWSQHALTPHKKLARVYAFEVWLRYRRTHRRRVRVL